MQEPELIVKVASEINFGKDLRKLLKTPDMTENMGSELNMMFDENRFYMSDYGGPIQELFKSQITYRESNSEEFEEDIPLNNRRVGSISRPDRMMNDVN